MRTGRPAVHTDDDIIAAIEDGNDTADKLLDTMGMRSKSNLMIRLRRMRAEGRVTIIERTRSEGYTIEVAR